jgi:hypothetical protein
MSVALSSESPADLRGNAQPDPELDRLFAPHQEGYLGADVALSIPIDKDRALWVFGDTLYGAIAGSRRRFDAMPRNSAALVSMDGHRPIKSEWILSPTHDFLIPPSTSEERWFWPGTGFHRAGRVYIFGYELENGTGPCESLAFRIVGARLFRLTNVQEPPAQWQVESVAFTPPHGEQIFCSAHLEHDGYLHLLGYAQDAVGSLPYPKTVMARIPIEDIDTGDPGARLEVLAGDPDMPRWQPPSAQPVALYQPGVSECTLWHDAPRGRYLATTYHTGEGLLRITSAPELTGPWSDPVPVYRVPEFRGADLHHAYTFRMHPELAANADEMVFTYVVNTKTLETVLEELDVYFPRFLRADLRLI